MKRKIFLYAILGLTLLLLPHHTKAAEFVTNGGFETGNFSGWTVINVTTNVWYNWRVTGSNCDACIDAWTSSPTIPRSGSFSAWNGWAAGNPVPDAYRLRQDITIPNNPSEYIRLTFWRRLQWNLAFQPGSNQPQHFIVNVLNPSNNAVLREVYRFTAPAASQGPMTPPGPNWVQHVFNISEFKGQTVRLEFMFTIAQNTMGPGVVQLDDISVQNFVPTAASVSVGGRVLTNEGAGISRTPVILTDSAGISRSATTNSFGAYRFEDVRAGETYILTVNNKKYLFTDSPRIVSVQENLTELNFIASP